MYCQTSSGAAAVGTAAVAAGAGVSIAEHVVAAAVGVGAVAAKESHQDMTLSFAVAEVTFGRGEHEVEEK